MGSTGPKHDAVEKKDLNKSTISLAGGKGFLTSPWEAAGEMCPRAKTITTRHTWISHSLLISTLFFDFYYIFYSYTLLIGQALPSTEL